MTVESSTGTAVPSSRHDQSSAVYPSGPSSESTYWPTATGAPVTASSPVAPVTPVVGPVAVNVQSASCAVPPSSLTTCLTSVNVEPIAVLTTVHVTSAPLTRSTTPSLTTTVAPESSAHVKLPAANPSTSDSDNAYEPADTSTPVTPSSPSPDTGS